MRILRLNSPGFFYKEAILLLYWGLTPLKSKGHIVEVGDAYVFPGILTPLLTQPSFQSHRLPFSHTSVEVGGENTPERKYASTGDRTHNRQDMSPTRSPLSHPGWAEATCRTTELITSVTYLPLFAITVISPPKVVERGAGGGGGGLL